MRLLRWAGLMVWLIGCGDDSSLPDASPPDGSMSLDGGRPMDGETPAPDGGGSLDAGPPPTDCAVVSCYCVRADADPGGDGSTWALALQAVPDEPERGAVYFVADGVYESLTLDAPESGEAWITIAKATAGDHGPDDGWDPSYGDGQAEISDVTMISDRWVIDGRVRDEADWQRIDAYGFRIPYGVMAHTINFGRASADVVFRYVDVGGPPGDTFDESLPRESFYFGGFDTTVVRWTISRSHMHDVYLPFQLANAADVTIERSWLGPNWSKETVRGQSRAARIVIRYNVFKDGCQGTPGDPTATGCTAQIAMWDGDEPGSFDGSEIYGNVIWTTRDTGHSDACILVGGDDGKSAAGVPANDGRIYNNTLVGIENGRCSLRFPSGLAGTEVVNNLWFDLGTGVTTGCEAGRCEANETASGASQFVDAAGGDFHLAMPTAPGTTLPAPWDVDLDGVTRGAAGTWDLGAYEHAP